jgi:acetylglutamate kinase
MNSKKRILFKYGGNAITNPQIQSEVLDQLIKIKKQGNELIIVHGGGPFIKDLLATHKVPSNFIDGHRITTPEALRLVEMALKGEVNSSLVNKFNAKGEKAVGLSGKDGRIVIAEKRRHYSKVNGKEEEVDLQRVGNVRKVDPFLIELLLQQNYLPVLTCIAADEKGLDYNINADLFAAHIAAALEVDEVVFMTDVDGLYKDFSDPTSLVKKLSVSEVAQMKEMGIIKGGMIPKMDACTFAIEHGAKKARIINGTKAEQIAQLMNAVLIGTQVEKG